MWLENFCDGGMENIFFPSKLFFIAETERVTERIMEEQNSKSQKVT